jgi:hypothetical protein
MTLPASEPRNPRRMASVMVATGRFHDVVVSASKFVHGARLDERDIKTLQWAQEVLDVAAENDIHIDMPSSHQLADVGTTALVLREAVADKPDLLSSVRDQLAAALRGERSDEVVNRMRVLQRLFSTVSRIALQSEVQAKDEHEANQGWPSLTTISLS